MTLPALLPAIHGYCPLHDTRTCGCILPQLIAEHEPDVIVAALTAAHASLDPVYFWETWAVLDHDQREARLRYAIAHLLPEPE